MNRRILYIEDELIFGKLVTEILQKAGYEVMLIYAGNEALSAYHAFSPHLLLVDVMLPGKDGFEVVTQIRHIDRNLPILLLTAKSASQDVVSGFQAGCNDYIKKPFSPDELLIRIKNWLEEKYGRKDWEELNDYDIGGVKFVLKKNELEVNGNLFTLTHKETLLLHILYRNRNHIIPREHILLKIWGNNSVYNSRSLDVYVTRLRKLLSGTPNQIITLKGVGYRFITED